VQASEHSVFRAPFALNDSNRYTIHSFNVALSEINTVPYVVDFTKSQSTTARPFYCSMYKDPDYAPEVFFLRHDWYFYTLKDEIIINTPQLYFDENWYWEAGSGTLP